MEKFKKYKRIQIAEIREVTQGDISDFKKTGHITVSPDYYDRELPHRVSISDADLNNGSPKIGDMIARNPKSHNDQWLIAEQYFKDNFEPFE